ncbi:hypothetical protein [Rhizobium sp. 2MFCol3.1]|uniref:hypothetical protein n=1 Tax=Rhizobium sp. 2MFCol3.1 TaxID=1246459 RepID=UPI0012DDF8A7|nr:hypothetical protein [Rhizobium sp. 2MFCol3.1]
MSKKESKSLGNGIESFDPNPRHYRLEDQKDNPVEGVENRAPSTPFPDAQNGDGGFSLATALLKRLSAEIETRNLAVKKSRRRHSLSQRRLRRWLERHPQS